MKLAMTLNFSFRPPPASIWIMDLVGRPSGFGYEAVWAAKSNGNSRGDGAGRLGLGATKTIKAGTASCIAGAPLPPRACAR